MPHGSGVQRTDLLPSRGTAAPPSFRPPLWGGVGGGRGSGSGPDFITQEGNESRGGGGDGGSGSDGEADSGRDGDSAVWGQSGDGCATALRSCPTGRASAPRNTNSCPGPLKSAPGPPAPPHGRSNPRPAHLPCGSPHLPHRPPFLPQDSAFRPTAPQSPPVTPPPPPNFPTPLRRIFRDPQNAFMFLKRPRRHRRHFRRHRRYFRGHLNSILALGSAPWPLPSTAPGPNLPRAVTALPRAGRGSLRPPDLPQTQRSDAEPNRKHCPTSAPAAVHCGAPRPHWPPPTAAKGRGGTSGSTPTNQKSGCRAPPVSGQ